MRAVGRGRSLVWIAAYALNSHLVFACKCVGRSSVCSAFAEAEIVFTGRAEAREPDIDLWDPSLYSRIERLFPGRALANLQDDNSPDTLTKLKAFYSEWWPEPIRQQISKSRDRTELDAVMEGLIARGQRVTFRIDKAYKGLPSNDRTIEIWTDFSDCGSRFIKGETYLVYGSKGEGGRVEAGACSRTQRLSDAGEDAVYLSFIEHGGSSIGRVYGFVTSNELDLLSPRFWDHVNHPRAEIPIELRAIGFTLMTTTNGEGRFVFDGLGAGEYDLAVLSKNYPEHSEPLPLPRKVRISGSACREKLFFVSKSVLDKE